MKGESILSHNWIVIQGSTGEVCMGDDSSVAFKSGVSSESGVDLGSLPKQSSLGSLNYFDASSATRWSKTDGIGRDEMKKRNKSTKQNARAERI